MRGFFFLISIEQKVYQLTGTNALVASVVEVDTVDVPSLNVAEEQSPGVQVKAQANHVLHFIGICRLDGLLGGVEVGQVVHQQDAFDGCDFGEQQEGFVF